VIRPDGRKTHNFATGNNRLTNVGEMKKWIINACMLAAVCCGVSAQNTNDMKTIRLIYPQWQGGIIDRWFPDEDAADISRGYSLGAQLMNVLAPDTKNKCYVVPVDTAYQRKLQDGVMDRDVIANQTKAALAILDVAQPDKIVTFGGECSVSVVPFTWLNKKYDGDVAMIWVDAHPDITLPGDVYPGYHAMAVTAAMGLGDKKIAGLLPSKFTPNKILYVGLRNWERDEIKERQKTYGIDYISPKELFNNSDKLREWLRKCKASKVVVHLDLDVLDASKIYLAVGNDSGGFDLQQVSRIINDIANEKQLVGLTVAEYMPRLEIKLQKMLRSLPIE
jgi:arginase